MHVAAILLAGALAGISGTMPQDWVSFDGSPGDQVRVELVESTAEGLVLEVTLPGFYLTQIPAGGAVWDRLELPGASPGYDHVGMPEVPLVPWLIGVPEGMTAVIEDVEAETVTFDGTWLFPTQEPATDMDSSFGEFVMDAEAYSSSDPWPLDYAALDLPGSISGVDVVRLVAMPFRYTAATGELEVAVSMRVTVGFRGEAMPQTPVSPAIARMQRAEILNYDALNVPPRGGTDADDPVYIVVTVQNNLSDITPLLQIEHVLGQHMEIVVVPDGSSSSAIMSALSAEYESGVTRFVLIAGRHQELTAWNMGAYYGDFFYSLLEGGNYPSVGLGRISEIPSEFQNQIDKIYSYMTYTGIAGEFPVVATGAMCAHEENYPGGYTANKNSVVNWPYSLLTPDFDTFYPPEGATAADLEDRINEGVGTVNYRGHGSVTVWQWSPGWNTGNIYTGLTNDFYPPVFNICCLNAKHEFAYNCLCESWMDADHKGASGTCGAAEASYTVANDRLDKAIYWALYDEEITNAGECFAWSLISMIDYVGGLGVTNSRMYHWFGDPAQDIYSTDAPGAPFELVLSGNTATGPGSQSQTYTVTSNGSPVEGVLVTASDGIGDHPDDPENFYVQGTTSSSGQVTLNFTAVAFDDITVGAWKHNYAIDIMQVSVGDTGTGGGTPGGVLSMAAPAPNPCSGAASVVYTIPSPGIAELSVFDLSGRVVATLSSGQLGAGEHTAVWDASGEPAGLYVVRLETGSGSVSQKLMVAR